jgi:hypothetical protein
MLEVKKGCSIFKTIVQGVEVQKVPIHILFTCELGVFYNDNPNDQ